MVLCFILQSNCSCLCGFENYTRDAGCAMIDLCKDGGGCDMNANCTMEGPGVKRLVLDFCFKHFV